MNPETTLTLDEAVVEVLNQLTGLDLTYDPTLDRYRSVTRQLNRALRSNALEHEWSWYTSTETVGTAAVGEREVLLRASIRPRIVSDDAVRLVDSEGTAVRWAYFLPRDAITKYPDRQGLWVSQVRNTLVFSRPFHQGEAGLTIEVPVMREPTMFRLPAAPDDPDEEIPQVPDEIRNQPVDFQYPDVIIARAAFYYAQTDPVMQPRVQSLEGFYKDLMYQIIERDDRNTDSPFLNEFFVPVQNGLSPDYLTHRHPHSDERR